jgi:hypothetical protein
MRLGSLFIAILLFGCAGEKLVPLQKVSLEVSGSTEIKGSFCNLNLTTAPGLKFYFIIDVTGSNATGDVTDTGQPVPPTDPGKVKRLGGMQAIAQKFPGARFALRTFAGNGVDDAYRDTYYTFTDQKTFLATTLTDFQGISDAGGTNYIHPLQMTLQDIQTYLNAQLQLPLAQRDPEGPIVIMFASDGIPNPDTDRAKADLQTAVHNITQLPISLVATQFVDEIVLNAAGYGDVFQLDPTEGEYINWLAQAGGGTFLTFSNQIDFTQMNIPAPIAAAGSTFSLFATNLNTVWEKNADGSASLKLDSDGDGLSDELEAQIGSDPNKYDTEDDGAGNGIHVSDGLKYFLYGKPCALGSCATPADDQQNLIPINSCRAIPASDGGASGYFAGDILDNCEKLTAGTDYKQFSYLNDKIPDGVKVRYDISPQDLTLAQNSPGQDGLTILQKILSNLPWWIPDYQTVGLKPTSYTLTYTGIQGGRSCYNFDITSMPVIGPGTNRVRLWLVQSDLDLRNTLRTKDVQVGEGQVIQVSDDDFLPNQSTVNSGH